MVGRLQALQGLHAESIAFRWVGLISVEGRTEDRKQHPDRTTALPHTTHDDSQRLHRLEAGQEALTKLLQGASESLAGVKASLQENVEAMAENISEVDARIAELLG